MNVKHKRTISLPLAFIGSLALLAGVLALAGQGGPVARAAPLNQGADSPVVTITQPAPNAILTRTPQLLKIEYACGVGTLCLGTAQVSAVSLTVHGEAGPYYPASLAFSDTLGGLYTYTWPLDDQDYVTHALRARARSQGGDVGASPLVTVHIDTIPPRETTITAPTYTENPTFTVSWSASDGSGLVRYDLQYRRDDLLSWTTWLTHSDVASHTFTVAEKGHRYTFRMQAADRGDNLSDWVTATTRAGPFALYLPVIVRNYPPPWQQGIGSQGIRFRTPSGCGGAVWYAGTSGQDGVWKSTDSAQTWTKIADLQPDAYPVVANPTHCNQAFAAVWGSGVYELAGASAPTAINNNLGEHHLYGLALTGTTLYAGASSQGIYTTSVNNVNWQAANDGIDDLRIRSLHTVGANLYAGGRDCAIYVSPDGGALWGVHKVLTTDCDDAQVWSVAEAQGALFAGLGLEKGLYYLDGALWRQVTAIPARTVFGLAFDDVRGYLYVSAYGAGIYRCRVDAGKPTHCSAHNLELTNLNTREIRIHDDLAVVSSDDGLWYRPLLP